jgi:hypothetical protein
VFGWPVSTGGRFFEVESDGCRSVLSMELLFVQCNIAKDKVPIAKSFRLFLIGCVVFMLSCFFKNGYTLQIRAI